MLSSTISCIVCKSTENPQRCVGCNVVHYCSKNHQKKDWLGHKATCNEIKKLSHTMMAEEERLTRSSIPNPFEMTGFNFMSHLEYDIYLRSRCELSELLFTVQTYAAVEAALSHQLGLLRLTGEDRLGFRWVIPFSLIRLNRDQECYEIVKSIATQNSSGDKLTMSEVIERATCPKGDDIFEPINLFLENSIEQEVLAGLMLIKLRMLHDLQSLLDAEVLNHWLPEELVDKITSHIPTTRAASHPDVRRQKDKSTLIAKVKSQVCAIFDKVVQMDKSYWSSLTNDHRVQAFDEPIFCNRATPRLAFQENPTAFKVIRDMSYDLHKQSQTSKKPYDAKKHAINYYILDPQIATSSF